MAKRVLLWPLALLFSGCMATTPTQTATTTQGENILAWYCYGMYSDMKRGGQDFDFYAYSDTEGAYVNVHGEDVPAKFSMDGLDATYLFGPNADRGQYDYYLIIEADGEAKYGDYEAGFGFPKAYYHCRKSSNSR